MARHRPVNLPAPYLRRIWIDPDLVPSRARYPFGLQAFGDDFEMTFPTAVTIIVGENGTGKSTLLEAIAALVGFDGAGGGVGYRKDHLRATLTIHPPEETTHSPLLMSFPGATLLAATPRGFLPTTLESTSHFRLLHAYAEDPHGFVRRMLADEADVSDDG